MGCLDVIGVDRREAGASGRQAFRDLPVVEPEADDERRRLNIRRRDSESAGLSLPGRDGLQHGLDASREDLAREDLERDLDRLTDFDVAGVDLRDLRRDAVIEYN